VPLEPVPEPLRQLVAAGMAKDPAGRPADAASFITELRAAAWSAYGEDWEDRGRSHLGEALLLLAALWPSSTAPAVQGHAVEQIHLSHGSQGAHQTQAQQHLRHLRHLRHLHHEHVEHLRHLQHLEHEKHLGQALPNGSGSSTTAEPGAQGTRLQRLVRNARHSNRPPRWLRRALPDDPSAGVAFAIVAGLGAVLLLVVGVAATITATGGGSGPGSGATSWHTVRTLTDPTTGNIKSMAISPTGGLLATGSFDGSSYLWNLASGQLVARVTQPSSDGVASLAFSPDGKVLALGLDSGTIVLRDVATMGTVATFSDGDGQGAVSSMAFSPDGATLAAADLGSRGTFLWDVATGRQVALLNAKLGAVTTAVFSPDGKTLATGGDGGTVLWNIAAGAQVARLGTSASGPIISAAFSPDGSTIATGGFYGAVLWNVATARQVAVFAYPAALDDTVSVAFSPDGTVLATAGVNTPLWATATRASITTIHVTASEIAFSPKGKLLATVTGQRVIVWAPAT
jgi:WD40 repeat protein